MIKIQSLILLLAGLAGLLQAQYVPIPYLQSPTDTSIWINWITDNGTESVVVYGKTQDNLHDTVIGGYQKKADDFYYHSVHLTNLEPLTFYYYRIKTGSFISPEYRFRSQPVPGARYGHYRFLIMGDHQVKAEERYEKMMAAAKKKVIEIYGDSVEVAINMLINAGDQVDQGTLDQYRNVHFKKSALLSPHLPIMTVVGNHETYGSPGLSLYHDFFFYDKMRYKNIPSPGGENYYSFQIGRIVFIMLSSEHPGFAQTEWVQRVVDSVKEDPRVDWVFSDGHRPIQAEQYVGDISPFIRDQIIPVLTETKKAVMHISGHHHLYARGQLHDYPLYHIISGGTAWDQYWGQSHEEDFDDVQKTIANWAYQIVDIDLGNKTMDVKTFSIGGPKVGFVYDNKLIDEFHRNLIEETPPDKPLLQSVDDTIQLPYTFKSSPFSSSVGEAYNSTQFQIAKDLNFDTIILCKYRDYEDLYGTTGDPDYLTVDVNKGIDIFTLHLEQYSLLNGKYFIRVRYRDRNLQWSEWSDNLSFVVTNSLDGYPRIYLDKTRFNPGDNVTVHYEYTPGNPKDWIGIYQKGNTPGSQGSYQWSYITGNAGSVVFKIQDVGEYFIVLFENDSYTEITERVEIYVMKIPEVFTDKFVYSSGVSVTVEYRDAPSFSKDWIGIYDIYNVPGVQGSTLWKYVSGETGSVSFSGLNDGYYFTNYFLKDGYSEPGERAYFAVGDQLATVTVDSSTYHTGSTISINYIGAPAIRGNWLGIIDTDPEEGKDSLLKRIYLNEEEKDLIKTIVDFGTGNYYVRLYFNDTTAAISNKAFFSVEGVSGIDISGINKDVKIYPLPSGGQVSLKLTGSFPKDLFYKIYSLKGQEILSGKISHFSGVSRRNLNLSKYGKGIYLLDIRSGKKRIVKKIVIM